MEYVERIKTLRQLLGYSQRDLAKEFNVAPGTISLWESGERSVPGPAQKLIELYESNLGMIGPGNPLQKIDTSWTRRALRSGITASKLAAKLSGGKLRQLAAGNTRASQIKTATHEAIGQEIIQSVGAMKGLVMKLAQMASYMDYGLPEEIRNLLSSLQYQSQPMAPEQVELIIEKNFGAPPETCFKNWSPYPFAAASIGQVHRATLKDGTVVAVKVQYPGIRQALESDLQSASLLDRVGSLLFRGQAAGEFMAELRERFLEECDYELEAKNAKKFAHAYRGDTQVVIPKVIDDYSTAQVLTTEFCEGLRFNQFLESASALERDRAGEVIYDFAFGSIFKHRLFNCDPHPGNYLFQNEKVVFLDFGCVKTFDRDFILRWTRLMNSIFDQDFNQAQAIVKKMGYVPDPKKFDWEFFPKMMNALYEPWLSEEFRFNPHYVQNIWRLMVTDNPNKFISNLPRDWIFLNRLQWGLYGVLAQLEAKGNWRSKIFDLIGRDHG